jgi:cysteinyl-tRNA synthetase
MKIYCSERKKKIEFEPINSGKVGIYVCGPTVYDSAHLGHGRSAVAFDVIRRYFLYQNFEVNYVSNYTDIDDKMINRAADEGITVENLAAKIIPEYERDYGKLGILKPDVQPLATDHVEEMISLVKDLEEAGHAYVLDDGVYFDVKSFKAYGEFSGQDLDELQSGARVESKDNKRSHQDFVLWKFKKDGEPFWASPWGEGRPGWHIECSAMTWKHLGESFDIHGGGLDLLFPHHECEVAQTRACFGSESFAKYWLHNGFITVDDEKMSKSLGNFFMLKDVFKKYDPQVVRFMFLKTHYRNPINFSDSLLEQSKEGLSRLHDFIRSLDKYEGKSDVEGTGRVYEVSSHFEKAMDNDFDTSGALGVVFEVIKMVNIDMKDATVSIDVENLKSQLEAIDKVFGVIFAPVEELPGDLAVLIAQREEARVEKDWVKSDQLRDELLSKGVILDDTPSGTIWKREL